MSALILPDPRSLAIADLWTRCEQLTAWAASADDLGQLDHARAWLAAVEEYLRRREAEGPAQTAARLLEARIGDVLGPPQPGERTDLSSAPDTLTGRGHRNERYEFRRMAAYRAVWVDDLPLSRAGVLARIARHLLATEPVPLPEGRFRTLVIDPPWPMAKIERTERPHQARELDYPDMSLDEIAALPIGELAHADGCHVYLWVTHRFLPAGLALFERWGVRYQCLLTWVKNVGMTPYSWMYDTEHVLFGRLGSLDLQQLGLRLSFSASVTRHSAKPDVFYERVVAASPGPRLEMFARQEREGFVAWGNEVAA